MAQPPPANLVSSWATDLRGTGHKGGTIRVYVGSVTSMCNQLGFDASKSIDMNTRTRVKNWEDEDGHLSTEAFDMVTDLPNLHGVCWSMDGWGYDRMLLCWSMFLVAMCLMARASDMTQFCPSVKDSGMPDAELNDKNGYPPYVSLVLRDWKWRSRKNKGKPYCMRVHRNYMDPRFCPVLWLLKWLSFSKISSGPIFQRWESGQYTGEALKEDQWTTLTARLFFMVYPSRPLVLFCVACLF